MDEHIPTTRLLALGTLEVLLNQALEQEPRARERLHLLHETSIRIRTEKPLTAFYILVYEDGIEVLSEYEGHIDVRIRGPMGAILQWLLTADNESVKDDPIRIIGPDEKVQLIASIVSEFSLWNVGRHWVENVIPIQELLGMLRREDPQWLSRLQGLPDAVNALAEEIGHQHLLQEEILREIKALKVGLRKERQMDLTTLVFGMGLLAGAFATLSGQMPTLISAGATIQTLLLASIGLTLILSRLLFGHKYR